MSDQGRFTWYELMSTDPKASLDFYANLAGWSHQPLDSPPPVGMEPVDYNVWMLGEQPMAGCLQLPAEAQEQGAPTHWVGYVHCDDIAATKARALELGATELVSLTLPEIGLIAVMQDPQQAVIALYQPTNDPGPEQAPAPGHFSWHELMSADYEAAWGFYSELFGWDIVEDMDMGEAGIYRLFGRNGQQVGGMFSNPPEVPVSCWTYYVSVPSVDVAAEAITAAGGKILHGPMEVPDGSRIVQALDPQGGMFALHSVAQTAGEA